jgi:hypothetical protein
MIQWIAALLIFGSLSAFAAPKDNVAQRTVNYETRQNGVVVHKAEVLVRYIQVDAGNHWAGCTDDCDDDVFYWFERESYKLITELERQGWYNFAASVPAIELDFKEENLRAIYVAMVKGSHRAYDGYLFELVKKDFEGLP